LAIVCEGARGATRQEIREALEVRNHDEQLHNDLRLLKDQLKSSMQYGNGSLNLANGLWICRSEDLAMSETFASIVRDNYGAVLQQTGRQASPEEVAQDINRFVEEITQGKVRNVVDSDRIWLEKWCLAVVNAVYFACKWEVPFEKMMTRQRPFTLLDGAPIQVPTMSQIARGYRYMEEPDFQAVELPYSGNELAMVVFLPKKVDGLPAFEEALRHKQLSTWLGSLSVWRDGIVVSLPRFNLRSPLELRSILQSMGIKTAWLPGADFSGIFNRKPEQTQRPELFMSAAIHKACVEVTEEGTVAGAGTVVAISKSSNNRPKAFIADHPFMFIIYHKPSGCILFMGRVTDPSKTN